MNFRVIKDYSPPFLLKNSHLNTVFPSLFRKVDQIEFECERLFTKDNDFIDINWLKKNSDKLVILMHGLEGNGNRQYIRGMAKIFNQNNWDVLALNYRSCSVEDNNTIKSYHGGFCEDLDFVINRVHDSYSDIAIVGFSLGANITLKYLGDKDYAKTQKIKVAGAISVPCDLKSSTNMLLKPSNSIYSKRFLKTLKQKTKNKASKFPDFINTDKLESIVSIKEFDDIYTGPLHGFKDADDYYEKCSCKRFLTAINIPTIIINALDDPFLSDECYPIEESKSNKNIHLLTPRYGGHVGFASFNKAFYWSEQAVIDFANHIVNNR